MARGSQAARPRPRAARPASSAAVTHGGALVERLRNWAPVQQLILRPGLAAALLLCLPVLVYLWPALVGGDVLSPTSQLYDVAPWRGYAPHDLASYYNGLLSDVPTADYPWRFLVRRYLHEGAFPSWNPYVFGGIPLWSNPQTGLFSPFSIPLWILPLNYGIGVGAALKLWAAGFGSYLLVRELRLGFLPALLAGVCFGFSAIDILWLTHETLPAVAALLPWTLWLIERIYAGGRLGALLGLAVATAIGLGGGHPGMQVHLLAAAAGYAVLRAALLPRGTTTGERLRPLGLAAGGIALGTLLMSAMLLPEALSSRGTIGTAVRSHGHGTLPGTQMPLTTIRTVLFPDWWGRPSDFQATRQPITQIRPGVFLGINYNERTFYTGTVAVLLAVVGLAARGRWRSKAPFVVLGALGLAIPLHLPGVYQLVTHLPVFDQVQNQRMHFVWALSASVLAAFGLQALLERPHGDRTRLVVGVAALLLGIVATLSLSPSGRAVSRTLDHFVRGIDFHSNAVLALTSVAWYLAFALAVGAALLAVRRWPRRRTWIAAAIVLLATLDMLHFALGYQPMAPGSKSIPPRTPAIAYLERQRDAGRFMGISGALTNDWALVYGLRDIRGYDPPQPSKRFLRLWTVAEPQQIEWTPFWMQSLGPAALQVANVLGARYVVAEPGTLIEGEAEGAAPRRLRIAYDGPDARVFENPRAAPRALVASRIRVAEDETDALATLTDPAFDPRREAVVERNTEGFAAIGAAQASASAARVSVVDRSNADVLIHARLARPGLVVLNDAGAPGWSVQVDGRDATPVRVNDVMRGVVAPAGAHAIEWRYHVPGLRVGAALSLLALIALAAGCVVVLRTRRQARSDALRRPQ